MLIDGPAAPRRSTAAALILTVVLSGVLQSCGGGDAGATSFRREPASTAGANPFMAGIDSSPTGQVSVPPIGDPVASPTAAPVTVAPGEPRSFPGDTPGLYGGTRDVASCDATRMAAFLEDNPDKARAWAGALGITTSAIADFVALLTPTVLRADTAVTNHGFADGRATAVPAVLQAGTAVLVDDRGVPAVKCNCGNPLTPPSPTARATYTGATWTGFSPTSITSVRRSPEPLDDLVMVDPGTATAFTRPVGTDGDADVPFAGEIPTPPPGDGTAATTTTTTAPGGPGAPDPTTTTTTAAPPAPGGAEYTALVKVVGGDCPTVDPYPVRAVVTGGTITFPDIPGASGPIDADGRYDFTFSTTPPGLPGGTATYRLSGRVVPPALSVAITATVDSPTGRISTCETRSPEIAAPAEPTSTTSTTTTSTTTSTTPAPAPTEQTWYFDGRIDEVGTGCDEIGVVVQTGDDQRIRVRDGGPDGHTVTFLGRPSRTLPVNGDHMFEGQLFAAGEGGPDQMAVTANGGPVPYLGVSTPRAFRYGKGLGGATRVPGTFRWVGCGFSATATPR